MNISPISNFAQTYGKNVNFKGYVVLNNESAINTRNITTVVTKYDNCDRIITHISTTDGQLYRTDIPFRNVLTKINQADKNNEIVDIDENETLFL